MPKKTSVERQKFLKSLEAKSLRNRSFLTKLADSLTGFCSSPLFLMLNGAFFFTWIVVNMGYVPLIPAFDPYPFSLLTMAVSLEAIFLSIFVLVSQARTSYISTLRDEVHLQVNITAEQEITKVLEILAHMKKKMGMDEYDHELEAMIKDINEGDIERNIAAQISRADKSLRAQLVREFPELLLDTVKKPIHAMAVDEKHEKKS
jgi:uncharacterized membrane protein